MTRRWVAVIWLTAITLLALVLPTQAQSRSVFWDRWDVQIDQVDTAANRFRVAELYDVTFNGGFSFGSAVIPTGRVERIENISVSQNGKPLKASCNQQAGTFCVTYSGDELSITYYFLSPVRNSTEQIEIAYDVVGGLRVYEGGDQLWWDAIPTEHYGFGIGESTVTVVLPADSAPREGVDSVVTYGAPATVNVNGSTVVAEATRALGGDEGLSIRVQYPHDPAATPPAWQSSFDIQRAYEENVLPLINIAVLVASVLIGLGGSLFVIVRLQTRGRDPDIGPVPEYLTEPPDATPPAVVGALVDETADLRDIISTLVDLARRGYLVFEEDQSEGAFGIGVNRSFTFKRTDKALDGLAPFETRMMSEVFSGGKLERTMASMRNTFYTAIPRLQSDVYGELVRRSYFERNPDTTRNMWRGFGTLLLGASVVGGFMLFFVLETGGMWLCLPAAGALVGVVTTLAAPGMPVKTRVGAESAAKWRAFGAYLRNLNSFEQNDAAAQRFDEYLAYAIAFGIERSYVRYFEQSPTVMVPPWYIPTYRGGRWARGYTPGSPPPSSTFPGDLARAGGGGTLDDLSGGLSGGLDSISDGLTSMLNSASSVMNSKPSSSSGSSGSWRSGGSSWSGGGFSGGGGGGGGSRGFG